MKSDAAAIRAAFLADIVEHPECDATRLIFADWLEDHGEPHAARFIRGQIAGEVASLPLAWGTPIIDTLFGPGIGWRGTVNNTAGESGWYSSSWLADAAIPLLWRRGFVHTIRLPTSLWLRHRVELMRGHPIERVELTDREASSENSSVHFLRGKFRWHVVPDSPNVPAGSWLQKDLVGDIADLAYERWSIHDDEEQARDWLSGQLLKRAKELAKGAK
jgi:uncharacterized protein (TIGR02996 family)